MKKIRLLKHRAQNVVHTILLLGGMGGLLALMGWTMGGFVGLYLAVALGLVTLLMSPQMPARLIFRLHGAHAIAAHQSPALHRIVEELSGRAGLENAPQLYWVPSPTLNAMAVGHGSDAAIGVTEGLLRHLDRREMTGVLAHEISHIVSGDTRVMAVADVINRVTQLMSSLGKLLLFVNIPLFLFTAATIPWLLVLLLMAAPLLSLLLQLALSRTREFDADLNAVRLTGDVDGLARALCKLDHYNHGRSLLTMFLPRKRSYGNSILRTHPHTEVRIKRLRALEGDRRALEALDLPAPSPAPPIQAVPAATELVRVLSRHAAPRRPHGRWYIV